MSEGPEADDGPNPFSFKNFVKRTNTAEPSSVSGGSRGHSYTRTKGTGSGRKGEAGRGERHKKTKRETSGGEHEDLPFPDLAKSDAGKTGSSDDNPFSFTKFIKRKESEQLAPPPALRGESSNSSSCDSDKDDDIITRPPKASSGKSTPSQSKRTTKPSRVTSTSVLTSAPPKTVPIPNSTVPTSNIKRTSVEKREPHDLFTDSESSSNDEDPLSAGIPKPVAMDARTGPTPKGKTKLEDLFDEPSMEGKILQINEEESSSEESTGVTLSSVGVGVGEAVISGTALEQLNKLKTENARLKVELQESKEETRRCKEKNTSLKQRVKELKKKEAEETKALEEMVLKVESNLETTTKRAISAESTIVKLKQEISTLQSRLAQMTPESVAQHYEEMLMGVREKANYSSQQLTLAAQMADQSIRELASGVDTLKNIADILQFIDNICEIRDKAA